MTAALDDLLHLMDLESLELNLFRGQSRDIGSPQVFGGQVLGQALVAAMRTIDARRCHSLHAYFLRPGDFNAPIIYEVDRSRDGHSFSSRRVVAIQHGEQIFHLSASFHIDEPGLEHTTPMPQVPLPEDLQPLSFYLNQAPERLSKFAQTLLNKPQAFEFRPVQLPVYLDPTPRAATKSVWFRPSGVVPVDNETLHYCLLAYVSDYNLIDTALLPHGQSPMVIKMASLDHALWFHRPFCMDDWLLYSTDSPTASGGRALARGHIYSRDGVLVASTVQEGLIRPKPAP